MKLPQLIDKLKPIDVEDKHPCWYATLHVPKKQANSKWEIGVVFEEKDEKCFVRFVDVSTKFSWDSFVSESFAIGLIAKFKINGRKSIKHWVKNV